MSRDERFETIYRNNYAFVYRLFRSCRVSDDESHDLAQETFKKFYEKLDQYRGGDKELRSYLKTIALRVLYNWIRTAEAQKRKREEVSLDDPDFTAEPAAPAEPDYAEREEQERRLTRLENTVSELSAGKRLCLTLRIKGLTYEEIAKALKITPDAVKSRLRDAKKHLRERLGEDDDQE